MSYAEAARMRRAHDQQISEWQALCAEQMQAIHALQRDNAALRGMVKQLAAMADQQDELLASALQLAEKVVNGCDKSQSNAVPKTSVKEFFKNA